MSTPKTTTDALNFARDQVAPESRSITASLGWPGSTADAVGLMCLLAGALAMDHMACRFEGCRCAWIGHAIHPCGKG